MAVYHKTHRDIVLSSCDCEFQINGEGRLVPDPSPEVEAFLSQLGGFEVIRKDPEPPTPKKKHEKRRKKGSSKK